ncbi:MAG: tetratricopeptide repeat protein [Phycisphaerales bacterium]
MRSTGDEIAGAGGDPDGRNEAIVRAGVIDGRGLAGFAKGSPLGALPGDEALPGYRIVRVVRRGGQGVVYEGVHLATGRRVAIKLLHRPDDPEELARFMREPALLSRIEHPAIVPVRDQVATGTGVWHVMDFVDGRPLDEFVRQRGLGVEAVLALMADVADAVHAAHLHGVIHRDLKPGNVLVDDDGRPHIVDFGLAKRLERSGGSTPRDATLTESGRFVGSLAWASPEQAEGQSRLVDLRTDVYALGVMLHHALTGAFPYPVDGTLRETLGHITGSEPAPLRHWRRGIDRDVEVIVSTCLRKQPERRYQSAGDLAIDLRRRLAGEPIAARADSTIYVLRKLLRRHRGPAIAAGLLVAMAAIASIVLAIESREAFRQARIADDTTRFFIGELLATADPIRGEGREARVIDVVDEAAARLDGRFEDPIVDAFARRTLGATYRELGAFERAEPMLVRAVELLTANAPASDSERRRAVAELARLRLAQGRAAEALASLDRAIADAGASVAGGEAGLELREERGRALLGAGRVDDAIAEFRSVLDARSAASPDGLATMNTLENLAGALTHAGRHEEAVPLYERVVQGVRTIRGERRARTALALSNLGSALMTVGRLDEASALLEEALSIRRERLGDAHPTTEQSLRLLGELRIRQGRSAEAVDLLEHVLEARTARHLVDDPESLALGCSLGVAQIGAGDPAAAVSTLQATADRAAIVAGPDDDLALEPRRHLARALRALGRQAEAEPIARDVWMRLAARGTSSMGDAAVLVQVTLAKILADLGRNEEAAHLAIDAFDATAAARRANLPHGWAVALGAYDVALVAGDARLARMIASEIADGHARGVASLPEDEATWRARSQP